jgi:uncharacterized protein (TIGR00369 family)
MSDLNLHPLIKAYIAQNTFGETIGMDFTILKEGQVEYTLTIEQKHLATPKAAHGGVISALLDATVGVGALSAVCQDGKVVSTVEMKVTFFAPALLNDQLAATSTIIKKGNRLLFLEADVINQKNELLAKASATLNAYPKEKAGYISAVPE